jgi:hypothetical protein
VPARSPRRILGICSGHDPWQMTMWQPVAVASRAAVSFVAIPPVPHCVPGTLVSTCMPPHCSIDQPVKTASSHSTPVTGTFNPSSAIACEPV